MRRALAGLASISVLIAVLVATHVGNMRASQAAASQRADVVILPDDPSPLPPDFTIEQPVEFQRGWAMGYDQARHEYEPPCMEQATPKERARYRELVTERERLRRAVNGICVCPSPSPSSTD